MSADDSSRVVLSVPNTNGTDYINASFVNVSNVMQAWHQQVYSDYHNFAMRTWQTSTVTDHVLIYHRATRRMTHTLLVKVGHEWLIHQFCIIFVLIGIIVTINVILVSLLTHYRRIIHKSDYRHKLSIVINNGLQIDSFRFTTHPV